MEGMDWTLPCKTCRESAMGIGNGYCRDCYLILLLEVKRHILELDVEELDEEWNQKH